MIDRITGIQTGLVKWSGTLAQKFSVDSHCRLQLRYCNVIYSLVPLAITFVFSLKSQGIVHLCSFIFPTYQSRASLEWRSIARTYQEMDEQVQVCMCRLSYVYWYFQALECLSSASSGSKFIAWKSPSINCSWLKCEMEEEEKEWYFYFTLRLRLKFSISRACVYL
jgi:hypothetical protein